MATKNDYDAAQEAAKAKINLIKKDLGI
jgi:hypothetical protein